MRNCGRLVCPSSSTSATPTPRCSARTTRATPPGSPAGRMSNATCWPRTLRTCSAAARGTPCPDQHGDTTINKERAMQVIGKKVLDAMSLRGCEIPGCDHRHHQAPDDSEVVLACRNCTEEGESEGVVASYTYGDGVVVLTCRRCGKEIIGVQVSE